MSNAHERFFLLYMMELDRRPLSAPQRAGVKTHLESCSTCQAHVQLYHRLHAGASKNWLPAEMPVDLEAVRRRMQQRSRLQWAVLPLRAAIWAGVIVLALFAVQWVFTELRPEPGAAPAASPTAAVETVAPSPMPPTVVDGVEAKAVEPLLKGHPLGGVGGWSPSGKYLFLPVQETLDDPYADRQTISLHFIAGENGQDCPADETFTGKPGFETYAWLDDERLLFIDPSGRILVYTACQEGYQDVSDRFGERMLRAAMPVSSKPGDGSRPVLLEGESAYWLLDPVSLQGRALSDPSPSVGMTDSFAWLPSGRQMSILQTLPNEDERGRLVVLDLGSGQVLRSVEIEASGGDGGAPIIEWMGADRPFVWGFGKGGPSLVDLSVEPLQQTYVLPELFGIEVVYPDELHSMGAFYDASSDNFHIVVHLNLPEDQSILLYQSESEQVERLAGERQVVMIFPGDQRMPLEPWRDEPLFDDGYDFIWVDAAEPAPTHIQVHGHTPRSFPVLANRLLAGSRRMVFGSSQGVSLVGLPGGETLAFWRLSGADPFSPPMLMPAPNGQALVVSATVTSNEMGKNQGELIYWIGLEE